MHRVLQGIIDNDRVASAYLFFGPPASQKKEEAEAFADQLGCRTVDRLTVAPRGASLKIEQIREIQQMVRYGPAQSKYLGVIVEGADEMTDEAAGAFLKTLEEPPPGVVFILLVEREDKLPSTIASRCQKIYFEESREEWRPKEENAGFYQAIRALRRNQLAGAFALSALLEKERERIEELIYDLVNFVSKEIKHVTWARILLEAIKNIKKKANVRLALDVACLKMSET